MLCCMSAKVADAVQPRSLAYEDRLCKSTHYHLCLWNTYSTCAHSHHGFAAHLLSSFCCVLQWRMTWLSVRPGMSAATPTQLIAPSSPVWRSTTTRSFASSSTISTTHKLEQYVIGI